jgi:anti-sigma regulatory factor (Ser/Thr protein kinase)
MMICLPITEASEVAHARRVATELARRFGFTELETSKVALVATEIATNLNKHATNGQLLVHSFTQAGLKTIELLALDKGPGINNVIQCIRDGYSTASSPGSGLGAIIRTSSLAAIHSVFGVGTAMFARIHSQSSGCQFSVSNIVDSPSRMQTPDSRLQNLDIGIVCLPKPGEEVCGDAYAMDQRPERFLLMVADGLGHGPDAAVAAQKAVQVFHEHTAQSPAEILTKTHSALRVTRGAAVAVAEVDRAKEEVRFCGVGNIAGTILTGGKSRGMVSHNGIVGQEARKIQEFCYPWAADALLVLHSDGLATRWSLDAYSGLAVRHPSLIAGVLYRDFSRKRDDVTVVVAKESSVSHL